MFWLDECCLSLPVYVRSDENARAKVLYLSDIRNFVDGYFIIITNARFKLLGNLLKSILQWLSG